VESAEGVDGVDLLVCTKCWGLAIQAKTMQGIVPDEVREKIENTGTKHPEGHSCPVCPSTMLEIEVPKPFAAVDRASKHGVKIDICGDCATIWFDAGELDALNGIKPKLREVKMDGTATKMEVQLDYTDKQHSGRRWVGVILGGIGLFWAFGENEWMSIDSIEVGDICSLALGLLLAVGGGILAFTTSPETGLELGVCSRCGLEGKTIGWTCQRGGCEAPICTTCRSVGEDPAAQYVKTLGGGALMVAGVVLGIGLLVVTEGAVVEGFLPAAAGYELISDDEEEGLLVCKECKKDIGALHFATEESEKVPEKEKKEGEDDTESIEWLSSEDYLKSQTHCLHVEGKRVRRCRRMVYRNSGYCYMHQRE